MEDRAVREFLARARFDVTSEVDRAAFVEMCDFVRLRSDARKKRRTWHIAVMVSGVTMVGGTAVQLFLPMVWQWFIARLL